MNRPTTQSTEIRGEELAELDFVAFLTALGFAVLSRERIRRYDLQNGRENKMLGVWHVAAQSGDGKYNLRDLRTRWARGVPGAYTPGLELDVVAMARLAMHNFRALTQLGKFGRNGCELYEVPMGPLVRLNNERSFACSRKIELLPPGDPATNAPCMSTLLAAVAISFGCRLLGYTPATSKEGRAYLRWYLGNGAAPLAKPSQMTAWWTDDKWLLDPTNDTPLAVAMMSIKNRKTLITDAYSPRELTLLSRLERCDGVADGSVALIDSNDRRQVELASAALGM